MEHSATAEQRWCSKSLFFSCNNSSVVITMICGQTANFFEFASSLFLPVYDNVIVFTSFVSFHGLYSVSLFIVPYQTLQQD